jgi:hypothetical protein
VSSVAIVSLIANEGVEYQLGECRTSVTDEMKRAGFSVRTWREWPNTYSNFGLRARPGISVPDFASRSRCPTQPDSIGQSGHRDPTRRSTFVLAWLLAGGPKSAREGNELSMAFIYSRWEGPPALTSKTLVLITVPPRHVSRVSCSLDSRL